MAYTASFLVFLVLTALAMAWTVRDGLRRNRLGHVRRALSTVALLVVTVVLAYLMGQHERHLPEDAMRVHRWFSVSVAVDVPLVALTGIGLWRNEKYRNAHRALVTLLVLATLGAFSTGLWVLFHSTPRA